MDSLRSIGRIAVQHINLPASGETFRDPTAYSRLAHQLSTCTGVSSISTQALEYLQVCEDSDNVHLRHIGQGQCGTVFSRLGTNNVVKVANPGKSSQLWNDLQCHVGGYQAIVNGLQHTDIHFNVPQPRGWLHHTFESWKTEWRYHLPALNQHAEAGLISERIFPLPKTTRDAIIDALCPVKDQRAVARNPENRDCLLRVYLGRRADRLQPKSFFKLPNLPLCIDDIEKLELDAVYARAMALALAIMHWEVGIDARDVEFVIGASPTRKTLVRPVHVKGKTMEEARATLTALNFTKPTNHLWLLDFNECREFSVDEVGWLEQLRQAFEFNDPYCPRPNTHDDGIDQLWTVFRTEYLSRSAVYSTSDAPVQCIGAVETSKKNLNSLF